MSFDRGCKKCSNNHENISCNSENNRINLRFTAQDSSGNTNTGGVNGCAFTNNAMFSRIAPFNSPATVAWDTIVFNQAGSGITLAGTNIVLPVGIYSVDYYLCANAGAGLSPLRAHLSLNGNILPSSGIVNETNAGIGGVNAPVTGHYIVNVTEFPGNLTLVVDTIDIFSALGGTTFPNCTIRITEIC